MYAALTNAGCDTVGAGLNALVGTRHGDRFAPPAQLREMAAINEELDAYNPLIPDGSNLKCTLMLEFADAAERRQQLQKLCGIEQQIFIQIEGFEAVAAIADEDLQRTSDGKTSAVHFMRYEFSPQMISAAKNGANWTIYSSNFSWLNQG